MAGALVGAMALASCGGGGGSTEAKDTPAKTTTTTAAASDANEALPLALTATDLGSPWKVVTPASGEEEVPADSCAKKVGALQHLVSKSYSRGAVLQRGDQTYFAASITYVFTDEAAAKAELDQRRSQAYQDCRIAQLDKREQDASPHIDGAAWRIAHVGDAMGKGDNGYELQYDYQFEATVDGKLQDANGVQQQVFYRHGRDLAEYAIQGTFAEGDTADAQSKVFDEFRKAITAAQDRAPTS